MIRIVPPWRITNDFAEALEDIRQQDGALLTYAAVLEAERPDTLRGACELLRNLDNYQRIVEGEQFGQQRLQETLGLDDEAIYELDGYMDFEKYGQDCMENDCVTKTEFGLLRRLTRPSRSSSRDSKCFGRLCGRCVVCLQLPKEREETQMAVNARTDKFQHLEVFDKPALFTNGRIARDTVPQGWYCAL